MSCKTLNPSVFCLLSFVVISSVGAQENNVAGPKLPEEAEKSWVRYESRAKKLQGKLSFKIYVLKSDRPLTSARQLTTYNILEFKQRDGCWLFSEQSIDESSEKKGKTTLAAMNPRYGFSLRRKTADLPWVVTEVHVDLRTSDPSTSSPLQSEESQFKQYSTCAVSMSVMYDLGMITRKPGFQLKKIQTSFEQGKELAKMEFEFKPEPKNPRIPSIVGWISYRPRSYWVIDSFHFVSDRTGLGIDTGTYEYVELADGFPVLKRIHVNLKRPKRSSELETIMTFDLEEAEIPASEFTLSKFGFPEPPSTWQDSTRWYLWFAMAAAVSIALTIFVRRFRRTKLFSS